MRLGARIVRLGLVCLALLVFGMATTAGAATGNVTIAGFAFAPQTITVNVGDAVTWTNQDGAPHSAKAVNGSFDTGTLGQGASRTLTFTTAGSFSYICGIHGSSMSGTVVVVGAPTTTAPATSAPTPPPTAAPTVAPTAVATPAPTAQPTTAATPAPTAAPTVAPTTASAPAPTAAPTAAPSATTAPGAGYYDDPYYGSPPDASPTPAATTVAAAPSASAAAAQPTASAPVASATDGGAGPAPLAVGIGALAILAIGAVAWRVSRR